CSDYSQTAQWYVDRYLTLHHNLKTDLSFDHDQDPSTPERTFEFGGIIPVRTGHASYISYREGISKYTTTAKYHESFLDLRMTGPRVAQYWMTNNPELEDIWLVCNIGEDWVTMPDGTDGVSAYFNAHYENGTVDYTPQVAQKASWYTPTTPAAVHDSIHYNQIGYNEVGRESVRNTMVYLGINEPEDVETTVELVTWDGITLADELKASKVGSSGTLVVPKVYPVYKSKEVTYELGEGLSYNYYDLLAESYLTSGTLSAINVQSNTVVVSGRELTSYQWELKNGTLISTGENENKITRTSGKTENGLFIDTQYAFEKPFVLLPDENWLLEWKMSGAWIDAESTTSKKLFNEDGASATPGASTILVSGKYNRLSIGYYGTTTHVSYGVNLNEYNIDVTQEHTYRLYNVINEDNTNTIYLFVDGEQIGPMTRYFTGSSGDMGTESNALSGRELSFGYMGTAKYALDQGIINYVTVIESGALQDVHVHDFSEWTEVSAPTKDNPGIFEKTCALCGHVQTTYVDGVWQLYDWAEHVNELPESYCSNTNLWLNQTHDDEFFTSGTHWSVHSSGTVTSITIPVTEGDHLYATSFGKAKENGHASSNGIRMTWFDDYGPIKTLAPADTYAEFSANGGYLVAPEGAKYANIPMWKITDENEVYILNAEHDYSNWTITKYPSSTENGEKVRTCSVCNHEEKEVIVCEHDKTTSWDVDGDGVLEILAIGNSFSVDALEYAYQIAQDLGVENVVVGNLYIGGCSLETHANNARGDKSAYTYYFNDNSTWVTKKNYKMSTALTERSWDYISMQQWSALSGVESSYNQDFTDLIAYVKDQISSDKNENKNLCTKLGWHMTWAYQQDSTHSSFVNYNKDQMTMYNAIVSAVQSKILTNEHIDFVVPSGTAVQNTRTSLLGDTLTRDGYHMSYDIGRYLTGLMFIKTVTGLSIDEIDYAPSGVSAEEKEILIEAVNAAFKTPYEVTQSTHIQVMPDDSYLLLNFDIENGAYWHPQKENGYQSTIKDATNSDKFFATIRFTKEDLPVGSIILLESGWQYRPDGWVEDIVQTGTRENVTSKSYVLVTEEWWSNYTLRAFNVSKQSKTSLEDMSEEDLKDVLKIYVPSHTHRYESIITAPTCTEQGYTTHTCSVCGYSELKLQEIDLTNLFTWTDGLMIDATSGRQLSYNGWMASDYVDISMLDSIKLVTADTINAGTSTGLAFYDADKNYISGVKHTDGIGDVYGVLTHELEVPENAVYLRTTWYSKNHAHYDESFGEFYAKTVSEFVPA
ncbi:MAG: DUF4886 domain-containing protein, partial [Erysipelotrichaceae bacterium]|nr:DUF4886 domain-containing protein [Erysipelotrichaceae bacterium]